MRVVVLFGLVASALLGGCASIVSGQNQSVSVETVADSAAVAGSNCQLTNNKGTWYVKTPGSTMVNRSFEDLSVRCEHDAYEPGIASFKSTTKGMAFGNIIFGGIIGAGVDISTGAAYDYPNLITVVLGKATGAVPKAAPKDDAPAAAVPLSRGDFLEYEITERFTGNVRQARWVVDEISAEKVVFNGGDWVEGSQGQVLSMRAPSAGDLDSLEPPTGWIPADLAVGRRWTLRYEARDGSPTSRFELDAQAMVQMKVTTKAGTFDAIQIVYKGYAQRNGGALFVPHATEIKLWYDPGQKRVVLFESEIRPGQNASAVRPSRERIELVRVRRS